MRSFVLETGMPVPFDPSAGFAVRHEMEKAALRRVCGSHLAIRGLGWFSWILLTLSLVVMPQAAQAREFNGRYKLERISGVLYLKGRKSPYRYRYDWGYSPDDYFDYDTYPFPPEGILAACLGHGIRIRDGKIRVNYDDARAEITKVILKDPRLKRVVYFSIKSLPRFFRFRELEDGTFEAKARSPLKIEVGVGGGDLVSKAFAIADYHAIIRGDKLVIKTTFRGSGRPMGGSEKAFDIRGSARIKALHK